MSYKIKDSSIYSLSVDKSKLKNYLEILEELKATSNIDDKINLENILSFQDILDNSKKIEIHLLLNCYIKV